MQRLSVKGNFWIRSFALSTDKLLKMSASKDFEVPGCRERNEFWSPSNVARIHGKDFTRTSQRRIGPCLAVLSRHFRGKKRFIEITGEHSESVRGKECTNHELATLHGTRVSRWTRGRVLHGRPSLQESRTPPPRSEKIMASKRHWPGKAKQRLRRMRVKYLKKYNPFPISDQTLSYMTDTDIGNLVGVHKTALRKSKRK